MSKLSPLGNRIIIEPDNPEEKSAGGVVLPASAQEKPQLGTVLAAGPGAVNVKGHTIPLDVKAGDRVMFSKYGATELEEDDKEILLMRSTDVIAVVEEETGEIENSKTETPAEPVPA